jgi:hypothetical protein
MAWCRRGRLVYKYLIYLDMDNGFLSIPWKDSKLALEKPMTMLPDVLYYFMDFFHTLACYLVLGSEKI